MKYYELKDYPLNYDKCFVHSHGKVKGLLVFNNQKELDEYLKTLKDE